MRITDRQREVLEFIRGEIDRTGSYPSFRTIAKGIGGTTTSTAFKHVKALRRAGMQPKAPRITRRQLEIWVYVSDYVAEHKQSPTLAEIADGTRFRAASTIAGRIAALEAHGYLSVEHGKRRGIRLVVPAPETMRRGLDAR